MRAGRLGRWKPGMVIHQSTGFYSRGESWRAIETTCLHRDRYKLRTALLPRLARQSKNHGDAKKLAPETASRS